MLASGDQREWIVTAGFPRESSQKKFAVNLTLPITGFGRLSRYPEPRWREANAVAGRKQCRTRLAPLDSYGLDFMARAFARAHRECS